MSTLLVHGNLNVMFVRFLHITSVIILRSINQTSLPMKLSTREGNLQLLSLLCNVAPPVNRFLPHPTSSCLSHYRHSTFGNPHHCSIEIGTTAKPSPTIQ